MGDRLATIDMGRKLGEEAVPLLGEAGSPPNTKSTGPRPTSIPSGILLHPAVWPQRTWAENWGLCDKVQLLKPIFEKEWPRGSNCVSLPNFLAIRPTVAEIWRFFDVSRWRPPPSWIFQISNF